jgi:hypothetical protein
MTPDIQQVLATFHHGQVVRRPDVPVGDSECVRSLKMGMPNPLSRGESQFFSPFC